MLVGGTVDKHNQNARYADDQRDDEAGARLLEEMEATDPSVTAMVIHVATAFMAEKAASN